MYTAKNYHLISFLSVVSKRIEKLVNNEVFDNREKCNLFLISSIISDHLNYRQIFWKLYLSLIELPELLLSLGLLEL